MTARFTKLRSTDQDDPDTEPESDLEEGITGLGPEQEQVQLILEDVAGDTRVASRRKPLRVFRRKPRCFSWVNSWRMCLLALVVFSVAIVVSVMVAKLAREPTPVPEPETQHWNGTGTGTSFVVY